MANSKGIYLVVTQDVGLEPGPRVGEIIIAENEVRAQDLAAFRNSGAAYRQVISIGQIGTYDPTMSGNYLAASLVDWHKQGGVLTLDLSGMKSILDAIPQDE